MSSFPRKREAEQAVMPAKAGIQVLNGIARSTRDFKTCLWVDDLRQVSFLCTSKERNPPATQEPQVAVEIARNARDTIYTLDSRPRLRGDMLSKAAGMTAR